MGTRLRNLMMGCVAGTAIFVLAVTAFAHHSAAEFDQSNPITITGMVKEFNFDNPHVSIKVEVKGANGQTEEWTTFGSPPNALVRVGWSGSILKAGEQVSILGLPSRYGRKVMLQVKITRANGESLPVGVSEQGYLNRAEREGKK